MHLYLIRHGETEANLARRYQGQTDSPLTAAGEDQARSVARWLADENPEGTCHVITSTLGRAARTGGVLADALGAPAPTTDPDLMELALGPYEGLTFEEAADRFPDARMAFKETPTLGEFLEGAETFDQARERCRRVLAAVRARPEDRVYVISHGGLLSILIQELLAIPPSPIRFVFGNTGVSRFQIETTYTKIHYINATGHLLVPRSPDSA